MHSYFQQFWNYTVPLYPELSPKVISLIIMSFFTVLQNTLPNQNYSVFEAPQRIDCKNIQKGYIQVFKLWLNIFKVLFISRVTGVASLHRFTGSFFEKFESTIDVCIMCILTILTFFLTLQTAQYNSTLLRKPPIYEFLRSLAWR